MTTDYRAELECLVKAYDDHGGRWPDDDVQALYQAVQKARAALSAPEQGPTDQQIMELMPQQLREDLATVTQLLVAHGTGISVGPGLYRVTLNTGIVEHCRAVLARWGRAALAQSGPVQPTDEEWEALKEHLWNRCQTIGYQGERFVYDRDFDVALDDVRQELARWGRPAVEPVPQEGADGQH